MMGLMWRIRMRCSRMMAMMKAARVRKETADLVVKVASRAGRADVVVAAVVVAAADAVDRVADRKLVLRVNSPLRRRVVRLRPRRRHMRAAGHL